MHRKDQQRIRKHVLVGVQKKGPELVQIHSNSSSQTQSCEGSEQVWLLAQSLV
jgi:hypothetical protein